MKAHLAPMVLDEKTLQALRDELPALREWAPDRMSRPLVFHPTIDLELVLSRDEAFLVSAFSADRQLGYVRLHGIDRFADRCVRDVLVIYPRTKYIVVEDERTRSINVYGFAPAAQTPAADPTDILELQLTN